jgi:hypothetical protein
MLIGILVFLFICMAIEQLGPVLIEALGLLIVFTGRFLVLVAGALLFGIWKALTWLLGQTVWLVKLIIHATQFLYILCDEVLRGPDEEGDENQEQDYDANASADNPYADACTVLHLSPSFTRQEFKVAYLRAISAVHPDKGGSEEEAQTINLARDALKAHHGW